MIGSSENRVSYNGNGVTTQFPFSFKILNKTDLKVVIVGTDGSETLLTSDYFVDVETSAVFYPGYSPGAEPPQSEQPPILADGERIVLYRDVPITQDSALDEHWPFDVIEGVADKLTIIAQQLQDGVERSFRVTPGASINVETMIPVQAGKTFRWSDDGTKLELTEDPKFVYQETVSMRNETETFRNQASGYSANADAKAQAAATSASNAKSSETNAATSASGASNSATIATTQAGIATTAATNASVSANNAKTSETNSKTSETNANSSAVSASNSATTATNRASAASNSASAAATSETNAANSANSARNSELEAIRQADRAEAYGSQAEVYDSTKTYSPADVVMVSNGDVYRCIVESTGENPEESVKWVMVSMVELKVFELDTNGDLMPAIKPQASASDAWNIDSNGDIMPGV